MRELFSEGDLEQALGNSVVDLIFRWEGQPQKIRFPCREAVETILAGQGIVAGYKLSDFAKMSWAVGYAGRLRQVVSFLDNSIDALANPINYEEGDYTALYPLADYYYRANSGEVVPQVSFDHFFLLAFTCVGDDAFKMASKRKKVAFPLTSFSPSPYYLLREIKVLERRKTIYSFSLLVAEVDSVERLLEGGGRDIIRLPTFRARGTDR